MKRWIALFLTLALALCMPGLSLAEEANDLKAAQQRILSDWFDYLFACENIHADMLWVLDAVDAYVENPSWETKQIASMATTTAMRYISLRDPAERLAGLEDYDAFDALGADVGFVPLELDGYNSERSGRLMSLQILLDYLDSSSYMVSDMYSLQLESDLLRRQQVCYLAYLKVVTEYILYYLNTDDQLSDFRDFVKEHCPGIQEAHLGVPDLLLEEASVILDELESQKDEMEALYQRQEESLKRFEQAAQSGDWSEIQAEATWIDGLPTLLPDPGWMTQEGAEAFYYWREEGADSISYPGERDVIDRIPDGCNYNYPGVPREEVLAYRDFLSSIGIDPIGDEETDSSLKLYYSLGDSTFVITWTAETTTLDMLENPLCLAPVWYIQAIMQLS